MLAVRLVTAIALWLNNLGHTDDFWADEREIAADNATVARFAASACAELVEGSRLGDRALPYLLGVAVYVAIRADIGVESREIAKRKTRLAAIAERRSGSGAGKASARDANGLRTYR